MLAWEYKLFENDLKAIRVLDQLLTADNETIIDLLDQALTVARMVKPNTDFQTVSGPLERIFRLNQQFSERIQQLEAGHSYSTDSMASTLQIEYDITDDFNHIVDKIVISDICNDIDINLINTYSNK